MTIPVSGDVPAGVVPKDNNALGDILRQINARLSEAERKTLYSAVISTGGLIVKDGGGLKVLHPETGNPIFYAGPIDDPLFGGAYAVSQYRNDGSVTLSPRQVTDPGDPDFGMQSLAWHDRARNVLIRDDSGGVGLSAPRVNAYLSCQFNPLGAPGTTFGYKSLPVANITSETVLWEGWNWIHHPGFLLAGVWGEATGINSSTYRVYAAGDLVGTWSLSSPGFGQSYRIFDVSPYVGTENTFMQVSVQASGTGNVACDVYGASFVGTNVT